MATSFLNKKGELITPIVNLIDNQTSFNDSNIKLKDLIAQDRDLNDLLLSEESYATFVMMVEDQVITQFKMLSFLIYHLMNVSEEWGEIGQEQVVLSFARLLCQLGPEDELTDTHYDEFYKLVSQKSNEYEFSSKSLKELEALLHAFKITIFHKSFSVFQGAELNSFLMFLGVSVRVQWGMYGNEQEFI